MGMKRKIERNENQKAGEFVNGYFNISSIRQDGSKVYITVRGYVDETARQYASNTQNMGPMPGDMNQKHVMEKNYEVMQSELPTPTVSGNIVDMLKNSAYIWLKRQADFATAEDSL